MANENVNSFFEAMTKDESIQQALKEKELAYTGAKDDREAVIKEVLIPVAEAAGYTFTVEDLKEYEEGKQVNGELNEDELEAVAGGLTWGLCIMLGFGGGDMCYIIGGTACVGGGF